MSTLAGATEDTPFTISYASMAAVAYESYVDRGALSFRVFPYTTLFRSKGGVAAMPGVTLLSSGESWVWTPATNANGTLSAFTIKAYDGTVASASAVPESGRADA